MRFKIKIIEISDDLKSKSNHDFDFKIMILILKSKSCPSLFGEEFSLALTSIPIDPVMLQNSGAASRRLARLRAAVNHWLLWGKDECYRALW